MVQETVYCERVLRIQSRSSTVFILHVAFEVLATYCLATGQFSMRWDPNVGKEDTGRTILDNPAVGDFDDRKGSVGF